MAESTTRTDSAHKRSRLVQAYWVYLLVQHLASHTLSNLCLPGISPSDCESRKLSAHPGCTVVEGRISGWGRAIETPRLTTGPGAAPADLP